MRDPYLDKPQLSRFWGKIKSVLFTPLSERVTDHENTTDAMQTRMDTLESRLDQIELKYFHNIVGISYNATFASLDDLVVTGVWNATSERIEF